jgi:Domain of unknown function (DUF4276)
VRIKPIVEGSGDVTAVPELLRRLQFDYGLGAHGVQIARPIKWKRSCFNSEAQVKRAVQLAKAERDCVGILIIFDSDDDCPKTYASRVAEWSRQEARNIPCEVVMANREYEAWFLSAVESLRGRRGIREDATSEAAPEQIRGAKERLETKMHPNTSYSETTDQVALTRHADFRTAYASCRSFRKLVTAFRNLLVASGAPVNEWEGSRPEAGAGTD